MIDFFSGHGFAGCRIDNGAMWDESVECLFLDRVHPRSGLGASRKRTLIIGLERSEDRSNRQFFVGMG